MIRRINTPGSGRRRAVRVQNDMRRRRATRVRASSKRPETVAVFGGDITCLRAVVRRWTGRVAEPGTTPADSEIATGGSTGERRIAILRRPGSALSPWPGGPLVWLFPERGPSETELAQLRQALVADRTTAPPRLEVVICLPDDLTLEQAVQDLATIGETLGVGLPADRDCSLRAVWLDDTREPCLRGLLKELEDAS